MRGVGSKVVVMKTESVKDLISGLIPAGNPVVAVQ